jgi:hypothetical protein
MNRVPHWFRSRLKAIDANYDVEWWPREALGEGRWAIVQKLWNSPSTETVVTREAEVLCQQGLQNGYVLSRPEAEAVLYPVVARQVLVFLVQEPSGAYRDLDERALEQCRERAWRARHMDVEDWIRESDDLKSEDQKSRDRTTAALYEDVKRDKIFSQMLSDTLAGLRLRYHHGGPLPPKKEAPRAAVQHVGS